MLEIVTSRLRSVPTGQVTAARSGPARPPRLHDCAGNDAPIDMMTISLDSDVSALPGRFCVARGRRTFHVHDHRSLVRWIAPCSLDRTSGGQDKVFGAAKADHQEPALGSARWRPDLLRAPRGAGRGCTHADAGRGLASRCIGGGPASPWLSKARSDPAYSPRERTSAIDANAIAHEFARARRACP